MKKDIQTITFGVICLFFVCYFARLFDFPNELMFVLGGMLCVFLVIQQKRIRLDWGICLLTVAMLSYYVIVHGKCGLLFTIAYMPSICYVLANYAVGFSTKQEDKEKHIASLLFVLVLGYTFHGVLNSYMYYAGYVVPGTRRWQDFWSREIVPGTQHIAYFLPSLALFMPAIMYLKKRTWKSLIAILITVFFGYTALATKSRMYFVIFLLVFCIQAVIFTWYEWKNIKKQLTNKKLWIAGAGILLVLIVGIYSIIDSSVMVTFIENMGKDGGILNNVRFQAQRLAVQQIFVYPMGGYLMDLGEISQAHNIWLDMANAAGIIPFFSFVAYTLYTFYELIVFLRQKDFSVELKLILTGIYGAFILFFSVEPALEASVHLVTPWIFINGMVHGSINEKK